MWTSLSRHTSKLYKSAEAAISDIVSNCSISIGGFGNCGLPEYLINSLSLKKVNNLTIVSQSCGTDSYGIHKLITLRKVKRLISSYVGDNENFFWHYQNGDIELEIVPSGTLAEKLRAGGAGIPAFYTSVGIDTIISDGLFPILNENSSKKRILSQPKEKKDFNGKPYLLEKSIKTDFAFVKAWKGDPLGNLVYRGTSQNFNPLMAMAAKVTIAEIEEFVNIGEIDPASVHTPGVYVNRMFIGGNYEKRIERLTLDTPHGEIVPGKGEQKVLREKILRRAGKEVKDGMYVTMGTGIPTLVPYFVPKGVKAVFHTENGMLGIGLYPKPGKEDPDVINTGKESCTQTPGCSFFNSAESYAMIRGGHLDLSFLGAMQVSKFGDISNWMVSGKMLKGIGGSMDMVASPSRCIILMEQSSRSHLKLIESCTIPITGKKAANLLITELGVFDFDRPEGMTLTEIAQNVSLEQVQLLTEGKFLVASDLKSVEL